MKEEWIWGGREVEAGLGRIGKSGGTKGCGLGCIVEENNFLKFFLRGNRISKPI